MDLNELLLVLVGGKQSDPIIIYIRENKGEGRQAGGQEGRQTGRKEDQFILSLVLHGFSSSLLLGVKELISSTTKP